MWTVTDEEPSVARLSLRMKMTVQGGENSIVRAMKNARDNEGSGTSPGAGLSTADEQADAAYADLINSSMDQRSGGFVWHSFTSSTSSIDLSLHCRGIDRLTDEELMMLSRGAQMWERGSTVQKRTLGILGDLMNLIAAVSGSMNMLLMSSECIGAFICLP